MESKKNQLIETKSGLVVARGRGMGEMGKDGLKVQTSSYEINHCWGCNGQRGAHS